MGYNDYNDSIFWEREMLIIMKWTNVFSNKRTKWGWKTMKNEEWGLKNVMNRPGEVIGHENRWK